MQWCLLKKESRFGGVNLSSCPLCKRSDDILFNIKTGKVSSAASEKTIFTIEQLTDDFCIYTSVYRIKFPEEAEALAFYIGLIRRKAAEGGAGTIMTASLGSLKLILQWVNINGIKRKTAIFLHLTGVSVFDLKAREPELSSKTKQNIRPVSNMARGIAVRAANSHTSVECVEESILYTILTKGDKASDP